MQVTLTIPLLFWRNLFTRGKTVTNNFVPGPSGGVTPDAMANMLYHEARQKCGITGKVYPTLDQWKKI